MIDTLGLPLAEAERILREAGYRVQTEEVRSKKGVHSQDARVLRQTEAEDETVTLTYAYCITKPEA